MSQEKIEKLEQINKEQEITIQHLEEALQAMNNYLNDLLTEISFIKQINK
jgi:hypothetical protein